MKGDNALWIPGTDHGGIATQNVVEKILKKEGKPGTTLGREAFLERMWAWRKESGDTIFHQLRKLGCSLDWTRTRFTMDEASSRAVAAAFVEFFKRGLTHLPGRSAWSTGAPDAAPRCRTSKWNTKSGPGSLWHIRYPFADDKAGGVIVATTRPETMLGDTAVAVNPTDERYQGVGGQKTELPLMDREIPLVADAAVDASFGTRRGQSDPLPRRHRFRDRRPPQPAPRTVIGFDGKMTARAGALRASPLKSAAKRSWPNWRPKISWSKWSPSARGVHLLPVQHDH
jgi:valyl-tRNA synthetase